MDMMRILNVIVCDGFVLGSWLFGGYEASFAVFNDFKPFFIDTVWNPE